MVSKGFIDLGKKVRGHHYHNPLVEWYIKVFQHDRFSLLRSVSRLELRIVTYLGDLWLLGDLFVAEWQYRLFVALVADQLVPREHGGFVAK